MEHTLTMELFFWDEIKLSYKAELLHQILVYGGT